MGAAVVGTAVVGFGVGIPVGTFVGNWDGASVGAAVVGRAVVGAAVVGCAVDGAAVVGLAVVGWGVVGRAVDGAAVVGRAVVGAGVGRGVGVWATARPTRATSASRRARAIASSYARGEDN